MKRKRPPPRRSQGFSVRRRPGPCGGVSSFCFTFTEETTCRFFDRKSCASPPSHLPPPPLLLPPSSAYRFLFILLSSSSSSPHSSSPHSFFPPISLHVLVLLLLNRFISSFSPFPPLSPPTLFFLFCSSCLFPIFPPFPSHLLLFLLIYSSSTFPPACLPLSQLLR